MKKLLTLLLALMLLSVPALASAETVVTSFYPIYLFALNLLDGVDGVEVTNLTEPTTGCLHDYQLQTGDMKTLARADAFLINGAGMEGFNQPPQASPCWRTAPTTVTTSMTATTMTTPTTPTSGWTRKMPSSWYTTWRTG